MQVFGLGPGVALALLAAVSAAAAEPNFAPPARLSDRSDLPRGVWVSEGYGAVADMRLEKPRFYDATPTTCLEDTSATELPDWPVAVSSDGRWIRLWKPLEAHPYQHRVLQELPAPCLEDQSPATPTAVLEYFATAYSTHYPFFGLYGVDWLKRVEVARSKVSDDVADAELFDVLSEMLAGVQDVHVSLSAEINGKEKVFRSWNDTYVRLRQIYQRLGYEDMRGALIDGYWNEHVANDLLKGTSRRSANDMLAYSMIGDRVGYLSILRFNQYASGDEPAPEENRQAIANEMRKAIAFWEQNDAQSVIVDLSVSLGGLDYVAREVMRAFIAEPTFVYSKQAIDTPNPISPTRYVVEPAEQTFTGPVFLLTSEITGSASEVLALGLRAWPNVVHYGEATEGSLSDTLRKRLPNGWTVTMANELYRDHEGKAWEGKGIAPHRDLVVFESDDPLASHLEAVHYLKQLAEE